MLSRSLALTALIAVLALTGLAGSAAAAPGDLDTTFGSNGITTLGGAFVIAEDTQIQPDGKILVAGVADGKSFVTRLNAGGLPDISFGSGGTTAIDFAATGSEGFSALTVLPNGKIVAVGSAEVDGTHADTTVAQLDANGAPDTTFNSTGKLVISVGNTASDDDGAAAVVARPDNKFVIAGYRGNLGDTDIYAAQFTATGSADTSFNSSGPTPGRYYVAFGPPTAATASNDYAWDIVRLESGALRILGVFDAPTSSSDDAGQAVIGLTASGTTDTAFGPSGSGIFKRTVSYSDEGGAEKLIALPDNRLLFTSQGHPYGSRSVVAYRVLADGSGLDSTFGVSGRTELAPSGSHDLYMTDFARAPDGGLFFSGRQQALPGSPGFLARATADGQPVASYGDGGVAIYRGGGYLNAISPQSDGHVIAATYRDIPSSLAADVVRLLGDYVAPAPPVAATVKIKSPAKKKIKASKFKSISGTAAGTAVTKVQLAIQKIDTTLLKKKKRCLYVTGSKGKTKKYKAVKKKCTPSKFLTAKGTSSWSYKIKLKPGKYKLSVRATGGAGVGKSSTKTFTLTK